MGNQHSRSTTPTSNPQSPGVTSSSSSHAHVYGLHAGASQSQSQSQSHDSSRLHGHAPHARRRESIQALTTVKASAAPPTSTLEPASGTQARPHARSRSQTVSSTTAHVAHTLRAAHDTLRSASASDDKMGNDQSRPQRPSRLDRPDRLSVASTTPAAAATAHAPAAPPLAPPVPAPAPAPAPSPPTLPVDVPAAPRDEASYTRTEQAASIEPADASQNEFIAPSSLYNRPPRLPLPIEQEVLTPGSPIISPHEVDIASPIASDNETPLPRRSSVLSSTTADDDDLGDEFKSPQGQPTVPVLVEWDGPGERVYVTGTFAGWNRKFKLHKNGPSKKKDVFSAYVHITPGTHHLAFLVDNNMRTSDKLPTAVDYTNILVNYLEVSADDVPKVETDVAPEPKTAPIPVQDQPAPEGIYPPQILPATPKLKAVSKPAPEATPKVPPSSPKKYHQNIPRYLLDLDAPEESRHFARANAATSNLPTPPTLPMFLSKSILNGVTPMKDDSSVLILPNHTVLNHLATSSIKDNILATSATTRYKQKFLTTIMYKPKHEEDREV